MKSSTDRGSATLDVPLYTLASYKGMGAAPSALRTAGLLKVLGAKSELGDVRLPELKEDSVQGKVKNLNHFKECTSRIYNNTRSIHAGLVFIVGGECSVTVGAMTGLSEAFEGKAGMLWLDAHGDFNTPETSPSGYIGGMCLAMACGKSPELGLFSTGPPPLSEDSLAHVGSRDLDAPEIAAFDSSPTKLITSQQVKAAGAVLVARDVAKHLNDRSDWIACHLDVDVVDPEQLPAVNYPTPGGLSLEETAVIMRTLLKTEKFRVLELTSYNAAFDKDGTSAKRIINLLETILV